ncbi:MAG TPA: hypothetical protein VJX67_27390 [Blastocatellia bacterium]|nr:hypothetical protein [Blastocatellia bacterium]
MQIVAPKLSLMLILLFLPHPRQILRASPQTPAKRGSLADQESRSAPSPATELPREGASSLLAVRGEITKVTSQEKGLVAISVKPARDFPEVTVVARENDRVGYAAGKDAGSDLLGLLSGDDSRETGQISAAELQQGDIVSIIYNPLLQNRALEIYVH